MIQQTVPSASSTVIISQKVKKEGKKHKKGKGRHSIFLGKTSSMEAEELLIWPDSCATVSL